jgi:(1->4)-alpha-D-glucan 1-alpha-D-glucosylmutase
MSVQDEITLHPNIANIGQEIIERRHVPNATYRLQFNHTFTFSDAQRLIPYLIDLGISDCYASPLLKARTGSMHGYDICDHGQINPALGGESAFNAFSDELRANEIGLILDMVPNHMGIDDECNGWWMDVLENGPSSIYASYFDVDWKPIRFAITDKVLLPILGDQYGNVLERGELRLVYEDKDVENERARTFNIYYYDHKLPVAPRTYSQILGYKLDELLEQLGETDEHVQELQSILTAIGYLPPRDELSPDKIAERNREKEIIKRRLALLYDASPEIRAAIDATLVAFNGTVGEPESFDLMDRLIEDQAYRPAFWRVATEEINYRRFFDINDLAAICVELPEVFQNTHQLVFNLIANGRATGLRIDHPDGLWNPPSYFRQLQESYLLHQIWQSLQGDSEDSAPQEVADAVGAWLDTLQVKAGDASRTPTWPLYVVAEKILSHGETLPVDWAVDGTTGYDFLNAVNGLFVDSANRKAFDRIYGNFIKQEEASDSPGRYYRNLINATKKMIMLVSLASEVNELSSRLERIAEKNRRYRDFTLNSLTFAIREIIACLSVYRTYITGPDDVAPWDEKFIEMAVAEAKRRNPRTAGEIFDFIRDTLLLRNITDFAVAERENLMVFTMKFQQITGPVMAKSLEDTAFYVYNRLVSLNEVGGHPEHFGVSLSAFHQQNAERQRRWPNAMLCSSTHDTKRSEDVRARINVLSEMPAEWSKALNRWSRQNARKKSTVDGELAPDRNDEYLLYQTLIGAWPFPTHVQPRSPSSAQELLKANSKHSPLITDLSAQEFAEFRERIAAYMQKATKESKVHTSWINPNEAYDAAVRNFVLGILEDTPKNAFLENMNAFQARVAFFGQFNALAQLLLKLTSPGMPDIYQGNELWDFSLVDPDNRRPVDYERRRVVLAQLQERVKQAEQHDTSNGRSGATLGDLARELLETSQDGRIKLYVTWRTLTYRRDHDQLFSYGTYRSLDTSGAKQEHVCAFVCTSGRRRGATPPDAEIVVVVPRLVTRLTGGVEQPPLGAEIWQDTWLELPQAAVGQQYANLFTGEILTVEEREGRTGMSLAAIMAVFPVALLERLSE